MRADEHGFGEIIRLVETILRGSKDGGKAYLIMGSPEKHR